jgi:glutaconate CoA-transferase subunit B
MRGPGTAGLALSTNAFRRFYIYLTSHRKYNFVEKVHFISGSGYLNGPNARSEAGLPEGGPRYVITPLALLDFEQMSKQMRLKSLHPGVALEDVIENTGFDLIIPTEIEMTMAPTEEELQILRDKVDPKGILRQAAKR